MKSVLQPARCTATKTGIWRTQPCCCYSSIFHRSELPTVWKKYRLASDVSSTQTLKYKYKYKYLIYTASRCQVCKCRRKHTKHQLDAYCSSFYQFLCWNRTAKLNSNMSSLTITQGNCFSTKHKRESPSQCLLVFSNYLNWLHFRKNEVEQKFIRRARPMWPHNDPTLTEDSFNSGTGSWHTQCSHGRAGRYNLSREVRLRCQNCQASSSKVSSCMSRYFCIWCRPLLEDGVADLTYGDAAHSCKGIPWHVHVGTHGNKYSNVKFKYKYQVSK